MLRIGIVSAARIVPAALIEPARDNPDVTVAAIAARDRIRAKEFASTHSIANVVDSYDELCSSDLIDAVYIAAPPALHREWTLKALAAGKHVLCEKPVGANADDAIAMVNAGHESGRVMMEAFHWRYHPMADMIRRIVDEDLGGATHCEASFTVGHIPETDIRHDFDLGGGALMDLGVYPLQWVRFAANTSSEPAVVSAQATHVHGLVDVELEASLAFLNGCSARIHCSMLSGVPLSAWLRVEGNRGMLTVSNPLAPQAGNDLHLQTAAGERHETAPLSTTYSHQLAAFVGAVKNGTPIPTGGADSIGMMSTVDSIYSAAGLGPRPTAPSID